MTIQSYNIFKPHWQPLAGSHTEMEFILRSRRNKGNKRNFRFAYCAVCYAQPVPKALSFISFISAGLNIWWKIDAIVIADELHGFAAKFPGIRRDTQLRKFFTMGRQIPGEGSR